MITFKAAATPVLLVLLLAACGILPRVQSEECVQVVDGSSNLDSDFEVVQSASTMDPVQLDNLLAWVERDFLTDPSVTNRLRLALLLIAGGEPIVNRERARSLLQGIDASEPITSGQQGLVMVLLQFLEEHDLMRGELDTCTVQTTKQGSRIDELEQQLRELTSIEQNIQHREMPVGTENER